MNILKAKYLIVKDKEEKEICRIEIGSIETINNDETFTIIEKK